MSAVPSGSGVRVVDSEEGARLLAEFLLDEGRDVPVVVVSTSTAGVPFIDVDEVAASFPSGVDVVTLVTGGPSREFVACLPPKTGVYGGAGRAYPVGTRWVQVLSDSPLRFAYDPADGPRATAHLVGDVSAMLRAGRMSALSDVSVSGRVELVVEPSHALVRLEDGRVVKVDRAKLSPSLTAGSLFQVGQRVTGVVVDGVDLFVHQSLLPVRDALASYVPGVHVPAVVLSAGGGGHTVVVQLFPGVNSFVLVDSPVSVGDVVVVELVLSSPDRRRFRARFVGVGPVPGGVMAAASLLPGGPPWVTFPEVVPLAGGSVVSLPDRQVDLAGSGSGSVSPVVVPSPAVLASRKLGVVSKTGPVEVGVGVVAEGAVSDVRPPLTVRPGEWLNRSDEVEAGAPGTGTDTDTDAGTVSDESDPVGALVDALIGARRSSGLSRKDVAKRLGVTSATVTRFEAERDGHVSLLKGYADITGVTVGDLGAARRVTPAVMTADPAVRAELERTRESVAALTRANRDLVEDRSGLLDELDLIAAENASLRDQLERARSANRANGRVRARPQQGDGIPDDDFFSDPVDQFRFDVYVAWARRIPAGEKGSRPLAPFDVGPDFFESMDRTEGVDRAKLVDVAVEVLTGLADRANGRGMHRLRRVDTGGVGYVEDDVLGNAWRVSLQTASASARRLHFWRGRDGRVVFAKVGLHDDMTI